METFTVTDRKLETIFSKIYRNGLADGESRTLVELGIITKEMKRSIAVSRLGERSYDIFVRSGMITERKLNPAKKSSSIVVLRNQINHCETIMRDTDKFYRIALIDDIIEELKEVNSNTELDWEGNTGTWDGQEEINLKKFDLCYDLSIQATSGSDKGDNQTPPSCWTSDKNIDVSDIDLFDKEGKEIFLSDSEKKELSKAISHLITIE